MVVKVLRPPPRIKVLEALGSIADGRISAVNNGARVLSSSGEREYYVVVTGDLRAYSNDNGTLYRGYVGYPIIALLMIKGVLPFDEAIARALSGIPWKTLNETYKRYEVVEEIVLKRAEERGISREIVTDYVSIVMKKLSSMRIVFDDSLVKQQTLF